MSDAKTLEELAFPTYWDARYANPSSETTFEWFKSFDNLRPFFEKNLPPPSDDGKEPSILHLGCGNSTLPLSLLSLHYLTQICIDFSATCITHMQSLYPHEPITWLVGDVRSLPPSIRPSSISVCIDKGTLDAMIHGSLWDPPDDVRENTKLYVDEVARVLKPGGIWLYITYRQPHFVKPTLERRGIWELEVESLGGEGGGFEYFGYVMRKFGEGE